ncbi:MAG: ankyrin repeat domain-containing protein [Azonexus sp.]|nr:ankyrin repeat domain-containing protein [Azonexus sp.]
MRLAQSVVPILFFAAVASAQAFEEGPAVPERLAPVSAKVRQRALPEDFSAVGKAAWEDSRPVVAPSTRDLLAAVKAGQFDAVKALLNDGALANGADELGERPLLAAVAGEHAEIARLLIQRGASPNVKGPAGRTPLAMASAAGNPGIVRVLLQGGAFINARSDNGATALHEAIRFDHPDVVRLLLAAGPDPERYDREGLHPLALAAALGRLNCLLAVLDSQVAADQPDRKGLTALYWARRYDQALAEVLLVERGASREAWPLNLD